MTMDPTLLRAAQTGDPDLLYEVLDRDVDLFPGVTVKNLCALAGVTEKGDNALHIAVREGHLALAKELCTLHLALVLMQNRRGDTPLHCAARTGSADMILLLTTSREPPFAPGELNDFSGMEGMDRYLLRMTNKYRNTALHEAVLRGHDHAAVVLLILEPELSSFVNYAIQSPLYLAARGRLMGIARGLLLCPFSSMDAPGGQSALHDVLLWDLKDGEDDAPSPPLPISSSERHWVRTSSRTMDTQLLAAARSGKTSVVSELARDDPGRLRQATARNNTALHVAAAHGRLEFCKHLCAEEKWLVAVQNSRGDTPLHCAARAGHHEIVSLIIDLAKTFAASDHPDVQDLHTFALLRARNKDGDTALHEAARNGDMEVVRRLVEAFPALSSFVNVAGVSPLYLAIERESLDIASYLLSYSPPMTGEVPAATHSVRSEVMYSPAVSHGGPYGQTTLHVAVLRSTEITELLLERQPDLVTTMDTYGNTPFHHAAANGDIKVAQLLLDARPSAAYMQDKDGFAPIHIAARMGHIKVIRELIDRCPDCGDLVDNEGRTFLHIAIMKRWKNIVEYVIRTPGLEYLLNTRDNEGDTPLHVAAVCERENIVRLLVRDKRVEKSSMNNEGSTPLDLAVQTMKSITGLQSYKIMMHLRSAGCRPSPHRSDNIIEAYRNHRDELQSQRALINNLALVAVLIATVSFAAAFTLPGGYNDNPGPDQGAALLAKQLAFKVFLLSDTAAMVSSITVACILIYTALQTPEAQPQSLQVAINIFWVALVGMVVAFGTGAYVVVELESRWIGVVIVVMACSVPIVVWRLTSWGPYDAMYQAMRILLVMRKRFRLWTELTWRTKFDLCQRRRYRHILHMHSTTRK